MLSENNWVVYPGIGLYRVSESVEINGKKFVRLISENNPVVIVPETSPDGSVIRNTCSIKDLNIAFKILAAPVRQDFPKKLLSLERVILSKFKTGSIFEIAEMVKMLSCFKRQRKLSVNEMKYLDLGIKHLVDETSVVKGLTKEESKSMVMDLIV